MERAIQKRLASAFAASGLTQAELARASGIDRSSISLYLSGRYSPKADKLIRLAVALGVSPEWLSGMDSTPQGTAVILPAVSDLNADGSLLFETDGVAVPSAWLDGDKPDHYFILNVTGVAMYPRILDGDRLLVRRSSQVPDGRIAVLIQEGKLLVRYLENGELRSANPEFAPRQLNVPTQFLGYAVFLMRAL